MRSTTSKLKHLLSYEYLCLEKYLVSSDLRCSMHPCFENWIAFIQSDSSGLGLLSPNRIHESWSAHQSLTHPVTRHLSAPCSAPLPFFAETCVICLLPSADEKKTQWPGSVTVSIILSWLPLPNHFPRWKENHWTTSDPHAAPFLTIHIYSNNLG